MRLAGRSGVEIEADDAVAQLQRVAELAPDDVASWRDLGDALAAEGRTAEAEEAWQKLAALRPDDSTRADRRSVTPRWPRATPARPPSG